MYICMHRGKYRHVYSYRHILTQPHTYRYYQLCLHICSCSCVQLVANAVLFTSVNLSGVFVRILTERTQRKVFLQARNCIEERLRLEDENEKQVSCTHSHKHTNMCKMHHTQEITHVYTKIAEHNASAEAYTTFVGLSATVTWVCIHVFHLFWHVHIYVFIMYCI